MLSLELACTNMSDEALKNLCKVWEQDTREHEEGKAERTSQPR